MATPRGMVDRCHALALEPGGTGAGEASLRAHEHPDYVGACFHDPDGNKPCVCWRLPE